LGKAAQSAVSTASTDTESVSAARQRAITAVRDANLDEKALAAVTELLPELTREFSRDSEAYGRYWASLTPALEMLAGASTGAIQKAQRAVRDLACLSRLTFLDCHAEIVYVRLTENCSKFVRIEDICYAASELVPELVPTRTEVDRELALMQSDKVGIEMFQGMLVSSIMAHPEHGRHLSHAMLLPRSESYEALDRFTAHGRLQLKKVSVERHGAAAVVTINNPSVLNSEDDTVVTDFETAVDVAILDRESQIVVLRGGRIDHPKYGGRRVFGSGINLTRIYNGKIPFLFYLTREFGPVNKILRGIASHTRDPGEENGGTREKMWIAAVEGFAIGGTCQLLLVMDYTVAEKTAYLTLPAKKEGIIPGFANLRLPRFVGDRIARQAIINDRRIECDSEAGRMICDELVPTGEMDGAIDRIVNGLIASGVVSVEGNRRAIRVGQERLDTFCRYGAVYAREQAYCHLSPALVSNLEVHWDARNRRLKSESQDTQRYAVDAAQA
jgi:(3,5-dihydroxyphenyl)acetyl-CoA 1,2-dioxygenase